MPHPPGTEMLSGEASGTGEGPQRGSPPGRVEPSPAPPTPGRWGLRPLPPAPPALQGAAGTALRSAPHRAEPRSAPHCPALGSLPAAAGGRPRGAAAGPGRAAGAAAALPASPALRIPSSATRSRCPARGSPAPSPRPSPLLPPEPPLGRGGCPCRRSPPPARRRPAPARGCCPARSQQPPRLPPPRTSLAITGGGGSGPPSRPPRPGPPRRVCPAPSTIPGRRAGREGGRRRRGGEKGEAEGGCPSRSRPPQVGSESPAAPGEPLRKAESRGVSPSRTGGSFPPPSWSELPPPLGCSARLHASAA